jgi:hypothetical protein
MWYLAHLQSEFSNILYSTAIRDNFAGQACMRKNTAPTCVEYGCTNILKFVEVWLRG